MTRALADLGCVFLVITVGSGLLLRNPPPDWRPAHWQPDSGASVGAVTRDFELRGALKTWQWWGLTATLFLNVALGVSLISEEDPILRTLGQRFP